MSQTYERRGCRRVPVAMPARLSGGRSGRSCRGTAWDASESGVLIVLAEHPPGLGGESVVEMAFPSGLRCLRAREIRRGLTADGMPTVALRLLEHPGGNHRAASVGRCWPACVWPRPRIVARAELRALGAEAYDLALRGAHTSVPEDLAAWASALASELGAPCEPPASAGRLAEAVRRMWDVA